jgi:hypothetical protein
MLLTYKMARPHALHEPCSLYILGATAILPRDGLISVLLFHQNPSDCGVVQHQFLQVPDAETGSSGGLQTNCSGEGYPQAEAEVEVDRSLL